MRLEDRIARFVVPSEFMRRRLLEWGIEEERVRLVRHFVHPISRAGREVKTGTYGAYVGRLSSEKGLHILLGALRRADDPPFLVVGDGLQRLALEDLARKLGLRNTRFMGWRPPDEAGDVVASARYVAIPSLWEETANLSALEALALARPLLVSGIGALPELVATGAGVVSQPGNEEDLSEKIRLLMADDELCRRASREALTFARRWLHPDRHLTDLEAVYGELRSNRGD
jgi:glycosyltransferase involved in cell wall biosynthesis